MSASDLRAMLDYASRFAERQFNRAGEVRPMWHAVTRGGESLIMPPPIGAANKDESVALMRALFELRDVVRYLFLDEAWTLDKLVEGDELAIERTGLGQHPERVEIVMFSGEDHEAGMLMGHRRIFRPAGRKPYLGPLVMQDEHPAMAAARSERIAETSGRLVGLLPNRGTRQ